MGKISITVNKHNVSQRRNALIKAGFIDDEIWNDLQEASIRVSKKDWFPWCIIIYSNKEFLILNHDAGVDTITEFDIEHILKKFK